jgi:signal transduction histidine kinase
VEKTMSASTTQVSPPSVEVLRRTDELALAGRLALELMHEINNPLDALGNLAYLALEEAGSSERMCTYLVQIEEQVATGLTKSSPLRKNEKLGKLAEAAIRIHRKSIASKQIHLVPDLPEELAAEVRASEILQVISNLIANALDALPEEGILRLRVRKDASAVHILIADNGHGIPIEHADRIYEPFFTTKQDRGTGLGLHISKTIVQGHRGRIRMRSSTKEGKSGTTFRISLPSHQEELSPLEVKVPYVQQQRKLIV